MRNIDRVRTMDAAQLADFLVDHGAEVPNEFCDGLCEGESCEECPYVGEEGDRRAWKEWLESEYDGEEKEDDQKPQEPEELQTDEQGDSEQGGNEKETDKQGSERSAGAKKPPTIVDTNVKTDSAIAEEPETVDVDESHGLAARPKRPKAGAHPKAELMKEMARSGASLTEIMEVAGCSEPTARKYMKEAQDE